MSTSACFRTCAARTRSRPSSSSAATGRRGAISSITSGSSWKKPAELFVETGLLVVPVDEGVRELEPGGALALIVDSVQRGGASQVPAGHDVGEGVVVYGFVVLVRADDAVDVAAPAAVDSYTRCPVTRRLDEQVSSRPVQELLVAGPVEVARCSPRDVGDDVLLELARSDRNDFAGAQVRACRRDLATRTRGFPGETSPGSAERACSRARRRQPAHAVLEQRARSLRPSRREEREHEDVGIPENVPAVTRTADASRAESGLAGLGDLRHQVEEREPHAPLQLRITLDLDIRCVPTTRPCAPVLNEEALEAGLFGSSQLGHCRGRLRKTTRISHVCGNALESPRRIASSRLGS